MSRFISVPSIRILKCRINPEPHQQPSNGQEIALCNGLNYAYVGNIVDEAGDSTHCPKCNHKVLSRNGYQLGESHLTGNGVCQFCGYQLAGRFSS
ncbi:hypothetical protein P4S72_16100 [Vibrio sp. PP-XX7]